jgi:hypothetical protein
MGCEPFYLCQNGILRDVVDIHRFVAVRKPLRQAYIMPIRTGERTHEENNPCGLAVKSTIRCCPHSPV